MLGKTLLVPCLLVASAISACAEGENDGVPKEGNGGAAARGSGAIAGAAGESSVRRSSFASWEADFDAAPPDPVGESVPDDFQRRLEAENGRIGGDAQVIADEAASGEGYVDIRGSGTIAWSVDVETDGVYALAIGATVEPGNGHKQNAVQVNGDTVSSFATNESASFHETPEIWVALKQGKNDVSIAAQWGWTWIDWVELRSIHSNYLAVEPELVTPDASDGAVRLMHYLVRQYGRRTLAGQQGLDYVEAIHEITDKYPAVLGVDLIDHSPSRVEFNTPPSPGPTKGALDWWNERGGVVTVMWHWTAPSGLINDDITTETGRQLDARWYNGFYSYATTFDLKLAMDDPESEEHAQILRDIDTVALELKRLDREGVPVLWRPLHEASGGWFWWGAHGPEAYLALYELLFERLTERHQLRNLIWVWNGQDPGWYPGDDRVDVVAEDIYAEAKDYAPQLGAFGRATGYSSAPKIVALSELGVVLDPVLVEKSGAAWSWFCLWSDDQFVLDETENDYSMLRKVYASERVVTLDELPDLKNYPLP